MSFYEYIYKDGASFRVMKDNCVYGIYRRLEDALYERDRLVEVDWDWDLAMELPETKNKYYGMVLPPFNHKYKYITFKKGYWKVYKKYEYIRSYDDYDDALRHAESINGRVSKVNPRWCLQKRIDGVLRNLGYFDSYEEARSRRDELIRNGWVV